MTIAFFANYKHKIKTLNELKNIVGNFPRTKKTILCHGVFDVVHPGHVRHLAYAKSKAEILIVSVTSDSHIKKGAYRPHIPERLRALNLAAFEMVDYVLIDQNAVPIDNIREIQPDFFAKGFEYVSGGLPPATLEEANIIRSYGGEIIFTPGDVVYSSSKFINDSPPKVVNEKLLLLMETYKLSFSDLSEYLSSFTNLKVHVVGDTIVDSYTRTSFIGGQTKTPTFSVLKEGKDDYVGGAGIVAKHLSAAGADVTFSTILGEDDLKSYVLDDLKSFGVKVLPIIDNSRPTTNKNVFIASSYRLLKVDTLDNRPITRGLLEKLLLQVRDVKADIVVFSDFRHGVFSKYSIDELTSAIPDGVFKVADSQVASRWGNITEFKGFDLITPNEREARFALADQDSTIGQLSAAVVKEAKPKNLILKVGSRGIFCGMIDPESQQIRAISIDSFAENVLDPVGAGDALLAYSTLSLFKSKSVLVAGILGSMAAACECEFDGNKPIKTDDVKKKMFRVQKIGSYG